MFTTNSLFGGDSKMQQQCWKQKQEGVISMECSHKNDLPHVENTFTERKFCHENCIYLKQ